MPTLLDHCRFGFVAVGSHLPSVSAAMGGGCLLIAATASAQPVRKLEDQDRAYLVAIKSTPRVMSRFVVFLALGAVVTTVATPFAHAQPRMRDLARPEVLSVSFNPSSHMASETVTARTRVGTRDREVRENLDAPASVVRQIREYVNQQLPEGATFVSYTYRDGVARVTIRDQNGNTHEGRLGGIAGRIDSLFDGTEFEGVRVLQFNFTPNRGRVRIERTVREPVYRTREVGEVQARFRLRHEGRTRAHLTQGIILGLNHDVQVRSRGERLAELGPQFRRLKEQRFKMRIERELRQVQEAISRITYTDQEKAQLNDGDGNNEIIVTREVRYTVAGQVGTMSVRIRVRKIRVIEGTPG